MMCGVLVCVLKEEGSNGETQARLPFRLLVLNELLISHVAAKVRMAGLEDRNDHLEVGHAGVDKPRRREPAKVGPIAAGLVQQQLEIGTLISKPLFIVENNLRTADPLAIVLLEGNPEPRNGAMVFRPIEVQRPPPQRDRTSVV